MRGPGLGQWEKIIPSDGSFERNSARRFQMTAGHTLKNCLLLCIAGTSLLAAGDLSSYRDFRFGMKLAEAAKQAGMKESEARLVHKRPAVIQELDWQPRRSYDSALQTDPIKEGQLQFYNGELSRIIISYDRSKVNGMTVEDTIEAISTTYGVATRPTVKIMYHSRQTEVASVLSRWENDLYSYNLVHSGDTSFVMVRYSKQLDSLASAAITEAGRLDGQEAPQRDLESQQARAEEIRLTREKARLVNVPNFRP